MATHYSILAWEIPWTEELGGLQPMRLQSQTQLNTHTIIISVRRRITPVPVVSFREASTRPEVYGTKHRTTWGMTRWGGGQEVKEIDDDSHCGLRDSF